MLQSGNGKLLILANLEKEYPEYILVIFTGIFTSECNVYGLIKALCVHSEACTRASVL